MSDDPLRATEAARRLGISTKDLLRLIHERKIRYVMVDGIAHVPTDALDEYRAKASKRAIAARTAARLTSGSGGGWSTTFST
jgi:excisionase family DNA binding protein